MSTGFVGNDFVLRKARSEVINPVIATETGVSLPVQPVLSVRPREFSLPPDQVATGSDLLESLKDFFYRYTLTIFILLFLVVAGSGTGVAMSYWSAHVESVTQTAAAAKAAQQAFSVLTATVGSSQLQTELTKIINQPVTLSIGGQTVPVGAAVVRSWLQVSPNQAKTQDYVHVNTAAMSSSLIQLANSYAVSPLNQVSVTHTDGITPSGIIVSGQNGTELSNPSSLTSQAQQLAKTVLGGNGLQFSASLGVVPFQAVTPAAFSKLIEVDVNTKRLYAYQNGQLVNTFLITAGAPATPTPIGEFHIWDKVALQTMTGPGYVQPRVPWINYFDHSGDAVHGNYWRPSSVFGNVNTSHGCVGVQVDQAEWIYNWAPIGTTVITHT
ncbi:MAG TPA: L,D-transpeptidase [Patescibacteria group bacterium]|jgi:lipoprotein-anchoring transpeptidase ErfK/SrfK|nr:L,D-transpeptidase [Patescibacteria group bacterium]